MGIWLQNAVVEIKVNIKHWTRVKLSPTTTIKNACTIQPLAASIRKSTMRSSSSYINIIGGVVLEVQGQCCEDHNGLAFGISAPVRIRLGALTRRERIQGNRAGSRWVSYRCDGCQLVCEGDIPCWKLLGLSCIQWPACQPPR